LLKPHTDPDGYFRIGPIPEGTPVNLLANVNPDAGAGNLLSLALKIKEVLLEIKVKNLDAAASKALMKAKLAPALLAASTCPDLITDRGHTYGANLPDDDKQALIEYLKTF
jgi:hypothetical protein